MHDFCFFLLSVMGMLLIERLMLETVMKSAAWSTRPLTSRLGISIAIPILQRHAMGCYSFGLSL